MDKSRPLSELACHRDRASGRQCPGLSASDNRGHQPHDREIFPGCATAYLPIKAIAAEVRRRGIPVKISNTASTYACNQIIYTALHLIAQKKLPTRGGFITCPARAYVAKQSYPYYEYPSMHLDLMVDAVKTAIETTLCRDTDIKAPPRGY